MPSFVFLRELSQKEERDLSLTDLLRPEEQPIFLTLGSGLARRDACGRIVATLPCLRMSSSAHSTELVENNPPYTVYRPSGSGRAAAQYPTFTPSNSVPHQSGRPAAGAAAARAVNLSSVCPRLLGCPHRGGLSWCSATPVVQWHGRTNPGWFYL